MQPFKPGHPCRLVRGPRDVDYLQEDEDVVLQARRHPFSVVDEWLGILVAGGIFLAAVWFVFYRVLGPDWRSYGDGLLLLGGLVVLSLLVLVRWRQVTSLYTVTPERVYKAYGRFRFHLLQTTYDKVTDLHLQQSLFGRWKGYGTVRVQTAGTGLDLDGVRDPVAVKRAVEQRRASFLHTILSESRGTAPEDVSAGADIGADAEVLWHGRPVLASLLTSLVVPVLLLLFASGGLVVSLSAGTGVAWTAVGAGAIGLAMGWMRWVQYRYTRFQVTDQGTILTRGLLTRRRVETTYAKVTDVSTEQDIWGRWFGYGKITINTAGSNEAAVVFNGIGRPDEVKALVDEARRRADRRG